MKWLSMKTLVITFISSLLVLVGLFVYMAYDLSETTNPVQADEEDKKATADVDEKEGATEEAVPATDMENGNVSNENVDFLVSLEYETYDKNIAYKDEAGAKELVADIHEYLNNLAGWGEANGFTYEDIQGDERWMQLKDDIAWLKSEGFAESAVINDMRNARAFQLVAEAKEDSMALRYLHRIFHDLDAEMNGRSVEVIWDVTHAFGKEEVQEEAHHFLVGYGNL